jgi:hypothetical protein
MGSAKDSNKVIVLVTSGSGDDERQTRLETTLQAGEHPCEAADRAVREQLGVLPFAFRKLQAAPHTFVTALDGP